MKKVALAVILAAFFKILDKFLLIYHFNTFKQLIDLLTGAQILLQHTVTIDL